MAATAQTDRTVRILGLLVIISGAILIVAGAATYVIVSNTLSDQRITVSADAAHFGGQRSPSRGRRTPKRT